MTVKTFLAYVFLGVCTLVIANLVYDYIKKISIEEKPVKNDEE